MLEKKVEKTGSRVFVSVTVKSSTSASLPDDTCMRQPFLSFGNSLTALLLDHFKSFCVFGKNTLQCSILNVHLYVVPKYDFVFADE